MMFAIQPAMSQDGIYHYTEWATNKPCFPYTCSLYRHNRDRKWLFIKPTDWAEKHQTCLVRKSKTSPPPVISAKSPKVKACPCSSCHGYSSSGSLVQVLVLIYPVNLTWIKREASCKTKVGLKQNLYPDLLQNMKDRFTASQLEKISCQCHDYIISLLQTQNK